MIVRFEVANFRSFHAPTTLLLTAGRERRHSERLAKHPALSSSVLPIALIYGSNAAGKTNLTEAIGFLKQLVSLGIQAGHAILRHPFRLCPGASMEPTRLEIDFVASNDKLYRYGISIGDSAVLREELVEVRRTSEEVIFSRADGFELKGLLKLAESQSRRDFLRFVAEGTRPNQPFLAEARQRAVRELDPVFQYFEHGITIIDPGSMPIFLEEEVSGREGFREFLLERLKAADLGIEDLELDEKSLEEMSDLPAGLKDELRSNLGPNEVKLIRTGKRHGMRFFVRLKDGDIRVSTLRIRHAGSGPGGAIFRLDEESDGTLRYLDLSVAFHALSRKGPGHVYVIDELDRSLHPHLAREALAAFLDGRTPEGRSQLIVTTHDATLMDQELLRRDEIWLAEKNDAGATTLRSLGEFKDLRFDTELQRNYLTGRFGGVPVVKHRPYFRAGIHQTI